MKRQCVFTSHATERCSRPSGWIAATRGLVARGFGTAPLYDFVSVLDKFEVAAKINSRQSVSVFVHDSRFCHDIVAPVKTATPAGVRGMANIVGDRAGILLFPVKSAVPSVAFSVTQWRSVITDVTFTPSAETQNVLGGDVVKFSFGTDGRHIPLPEGDMAAWYLRLLIGLGSYAAGHPDAITDGVPANLVLSEHTGNYTDDAEELDCAGEPGQSKSPHTRLGHKRYYKHPRYTNVRFTTGDVKPCQINGKAVTVYARGRGLVRVAEAAIGGSPVLICR